MAWRWNPRANRYQDDITGRFMPRTQALNMVDESLAATTDVVLRLSELVGDGRLDPDAWVSRMREQIKREYIRQYGFGRGGLNNMGRSDWGRIGGMLKRQYKFLDDFAEDIKNKNLTPGQINTRASMYINSARQAYERGNAVATGVPVSKLPAYPGDGTTDCLTRCNCHWRFIAVRDANGEIVAWEAYWVLEPGSEHCDTCLERAGKWNPLLIQLRENRSVLTYG